ncbi:MAG: hypothetical protein Q9174_000915 [Haloplaca sp. 1 TL-2023]
MYSVELLTAALMASMATASPYVGAPDSFLKRQLPVHKASFTWNGNCGSTVACGPAAAGAPGIGGAAINTLAFQNPAGAINGAGNVPLTNGQGAACGGCWHLTPTENWFKTNSKPLGTSVVVKINDHCPDGGYCDQSAANPFNTGGYDAPVHFDLCAATGVAQQFFGESGPGVLMGLAQYSPDCAGLDDGAFGSTLPGLA